MALHLLTGSGAPAFTPDAPGQHYVDTTGGFEYFSVGTSSPADWVLRGSGGVETPMTEDLDVGGFDIIGSPGTTGGPVDIVGGEATGGSGETPGAVNITGGQNTGGSGGDGGAVNISGATSTSFGWQGGGVTVRSGDSGGGSGGGGDLAIYTGEGVTGCGDIRIEAMPPGGITVYDEAGSGRIDIDCGNVGTLSSGSGGLLDIDGGDGGTGPGGGLRRGGQIRIDAGDGGDSDYDDNGNNNASNAGRANGPSRFTAGDGGEFFGNTFNDNVLAGSQGAPGQFTVAGDQTSVYTASLVIGYDNDSGDSTANNALYTVTGSTFGGVNTDVDVVEQIGTGSPNFDGDLYPDLGTGIGGDGSDLELHAGDGGGSYNSKVTGSGDGGNMEIYAGHAGENEFVNAATNSSGGYIEIIAGRSNGGLIGGDIRIEAGGHNTSDTPSDTGRLIIGSTNLDSVRTPAPVLYEDAQGVGPIGYVGFKAPDFVPSATTGNGLNTVWTLPEGDGGDGATMITDGAGTLSWSGVVPLERVILTPGIGTHTLFFYDMAFLPPPGFGTVRLKGEVVAHDPTSGAPPGEGGFGDFDVTAQYAGPGAPVAVGPPVATFVGLPTAAGSGLAVALTVGPDGIALDFVQATVATPISVRLNVTVLVIT